jgi:hypothetical protein
MARKKFAKKKRKKRKEKTRYQNHLRGDNCYDVCTDAVFLHSKYFRHYGHRKFIML